MYRTKGRKPNTYQAQYRDGVDIDTIGGDIVLDFQSGNFQYLDGGGSDRNVDLPAEEDEKANGLMFCVTNTGSTNDLIVRNDAAATIATVTPGSQRWVGCDGAAWAG